jgi:tetratricopeptide (TPR) repeat protein
MTTPSPEVNSMKSVLLATLAGAFALALPLSAPAQESNSYQPPKLIKQGTATSPISGKGTVIVKVLVHADGTFVVQNVLKSTNHADDAAALEIARTSRYRPALRNGKATLAFYDFSLKFAGSKVSSAGEGGGGGAGGEVDRYNRMISAGNFSGAKSGLTEYLAAHPGDVPASLALGLASVHLSDYAGAVKAFDQAGTLPARYAPLAATAYLQYATESARGSDPQAAVAAAKKAVRYLPNAPTYNALGYAEIAAGSTDAVADLEKARSLAAADSKMTTGARGTIAVNLVQAYLLAGKADQAKALADETAKADPASGKLAYVALANDYVKKANAKAKTGDQAAAAALFESGAQAVPAQAVTLYSQAAFAYLNMKPNPDTAKAKVAADKALALAPDDPEANFAEGVGLADAGNSKDALVYLNKADAAAKKGTNAGLTANIEAVIKQLSSPKS